MVVCVDMPSDAKRALDALMQTGEFRDVSEAVSAAVKNYEVIYRAVARGESVDLSPTSTNITLPPGETSISTKGIGIPSLFEVLTWNTDISGLRPIVLPKLATDLPPTKWMFGQFNKFLPAKAA